MIGIGLDLNTTNYHLRWSLEGQVRKCKHAARAGISAEALDEWIDELKNSAAQAALGQPDHGFAGWHGRQPDRS